LLIGIAIKLLLLVGATVAVATATMPLLMVLALMPVARHVTDPRLDMQLSVLPGPVSAAPATMLKELISVGEYESFHCKPAGALVAAFNERFSEREAPFTADPEAKLKDET
jgi:hypothetical protein